MAAFSKGKNEAIARALKGHMATRAEVDDHVRAAEAAVAMVSEHCPRQTARTRHAVKLWLRYALRCAEAHRLSNGAGALVFCESLEAACDDALDALSIACDIPHGTH